MLANQSARRARAVWLRIDGSRRAIFAAVEHAIARQAPGAALLLALVGMLVAAGRVPMVTVFGAAALFAASVTFAFYAGLATLDPVRRASVALVLCWLALIAAAQIGVAALSREVPAWRWIAVDIAGLAGASAALRALALRRWRRVDWCELRPLRGVWRVRRGR